MELSISKYGHTVKISLHDGGVRIQTPRQALTVRIKCQIGAIMGEAARFKSWLSYFFLEVSKANLYISKTKKNTDLNKC